jgi:hypothetical protein
MTTHVTKKEVNSGGLLVALCLLFSLAAQSSALAQARYSITDLGTLRGRQQHSELDHKQGRRDRRIRHRSIRQFR